MQRSPRKSRIVVAKMRSPTVPHFRLTDRRINMMIDVQQRRRFRWHKINDKNDRLAANRQITKSGMVLFIA
jgi:hypothetical protein